MFRNMLELNDLKSQETGTAVALPTTMTALAPEVTAHGLALWRLHRQPDQRLHCLVGKFSGKLVLAVHSEGKVLVAESHSDIVTLVNQAEAMKASYLNKGWNELDVERDDTR